MADREGGEHEVQEEVDNHAGPNPNHPPPPGPNQNNAPPHNAPFPIAEQLALITAQLTALQAGQQAREETRRREEAAYEDRMREMGRMMEQLHLLQAPPPPPLTHATAPQVIEVTPLPNLPVSRLLLACRLSPRRRPVTQTGGGR